MKPTLTIKLLNRQHCVEALQSKTFENANLSPQEEAALGPVISSSLKNGNDAILIFVLPEDGRAEIVGSRVRIDSHLMIAPWEVPMDNMKKHFRRLTDKQRKVVPLLPFYNNKEIEEQTGEKYNTVRKIRITFYKRTGCHSDGDFVIILMRYNLISKIETGRL